MSISDLIIIFTVFPRIKAIMVILQIIKKNPALFDPNNKNLVLLSYRVTHVLHARFKI